jgi:hypothetical protein
MDGVTNGAANMAQAPSPGGGAAGRPWLLRTDLRAAYAVATPLLVAVCLVNITTLLHDLPRLAPWRPITWEITSLIAVLAALWIVFRAQVLAPVPTQRWGRALAIHILAATAFSAAHCVFMWTLRRLFYTAVGAPYGWTVPASQLLYEYRKDLVSYLVLGGLYWCVTRLRTAPVPPAMPTTGPTWQAPATLDIRDGAKLVRAPIADIVAAEAAGNYVTILLSDGQCPLMRTTLTALEATLSPHGFLRVHRGWLVHPAHVRIVEPTGTGDYRLTLSNGTTTPLSRRYPDAVRTLRNASAPA